MGFQKWIVKKIDKREVLNLVDVYGVPPLSAGVLISRGICAPEDIMEFILPTAEKTEEIQWYGIDKIVLEINSCINSNSKICIYGDYDADGITATALMYEYLRYRGANVCYYIPERDRDGYGLNKNAISKLKSNGVDVILTVDNGVTAHQEIDYANQNGIKVLVTDHHRIPEILPNAAAIVDPHIPVEGVKYCNNFAGVGVVFKIVEACEKANKNFNISQYLDLVAIGTIGDSIDLIGEARIMVKRGLEEISKGNRPGISVLTENLSLHTKALDGSDVSFYLVPKINACGRLNQAETAIKLLLSENKSEAIETYEKTVKLNSIRKNIEEEIFFEAEEFLKNHPETLYHNIIIIHGENWHRGVIGIVASKIMEKYGKPCMLITLDGENATGSCRSIDDFSIYDLICSCSEILERFGGHRMAAGVNLKAENVIRFKNMIWEKSDKIPAIMRKLTIDLCLNPSKISTKFFEDLDLLKPFGCGNPEPVFGIMNVKLIGTKSMGNGNHIKLTLKSADGFVFDAVYFKKKEREFLYYPGEILDLAVKLSPNFYYGIFSVTKIIVDVRLSDYDFENAILQKRIYEKFKLGENLEPSEKDCLKISRDEIIKVYKYLKSHTESDTRADVLCERVFENNQNIAKIYIIMDALKELNLIDFVKNGDDYQFSINYKIERVNLKNSTILRELNLQIGGNQYS